METAVGRSRRRVSFLIMRKDCFCEYRDEWGMVLLILLVVEAQKIGEKSFCIEFSREIKWVCIDV